MRRLFMVCAALLFYAASASAQTKVSGTAQCGKPDPQQAIPVGDRPGHMLGIAQIKCTYTKPMEIGGDKSKDGVSTETSDISGNTSRPRGFHVVTMESGDKVFFTYQGTATTKDNALVDLKGNWGINGGSGKMKGIKGKGTFTCAPSGDGLSCDVEGEYQLTK
ncbi:MAG TPA: hypothetical protein VJN92_03260 [Candidatus Acidoferrum sp.]|nr:hypothetical protein [Candidatus Acidoferrum sp.]